jgi:tetratricopeptide (TPR) repeat protein
MSDVGAREAESGGRVSARILRGLGGCAWLRGLVCALLVTLCGAERAQAQAPTSTGPPTPARLLVIPFENDTHDGRVYWLSEAAAVALTDDLLALGAPAITRDNRLRAFERLHVPPVATLSHATVIRLGEIVGAAQVVVGSFEVANDALTVHARTIRIDVGRISPEIVERGPLNDLFAIYGRVARRIDPGSGVSTAEMERGHPPLPAFEQYIKGELAVAASAKVSYLTQALKVAPAFERARLSLWAVYNDQGEHQKALTAVSGVAADSRFARQARFLGAVSQLKLGQYQNAYDALSDLNTVAPDPAILNNLGVVQLRRNVWTGSARPTWFFSDATKLDPNDSDLFFNLGYAYWLDKDMPAAVMWLREAVRRNPADDAAHYVLGVALQAAGSTTEAAREKELAKRLSSTYVEWDRQQGGNTVPRGLERIKTEVDVPAALRLDNVIVAAGQRDQRDLAMFHLQSGRRLFESERDAEAIAELRRAVYLAPYESEAHLLLGRLYLRGGRVQDAIDALKISIWSEDTITAHLVLAEAYIAAKDATAARAELQAILKRDPANVDARVLMDRVP